MSQKQHHTSPRRSIYNTKLWDKVRNYGEYDNWLDYYKKKVFQIKPILRTNKTN